MKQIIVDRMGTHIVLSIEHPQADRLLKNADQLLEDFETRFSANDPSSLLMEINKNAGIKAVNVDEDLFDLIKIGMEHSLSEDNTLNIAIGPLVKLWKIGFEEAHVPAGEDIQEKLSLIDPKNITLNEETSSVYLEKKGMEIDLGAVAKGYFADQLKDYFIDNGVENGLIDLGGNVLTIGNNPKYEDGHWRVGIQNPTEKRGGLLAAVLVKDKSVVTSGIYERYLEMDGEKYHHIFDSKTGYPIDNKLASITIISDKSIDGELWTTLLFKKNTSEAVDYVETIPGIELIAISKDNDVSMTSKIKPYVAIVN